MNRALNIWTNLIYAAAGLVAWIDGFTPFVLACFVLAAGSAAFHMYHDDPEKRYWSHHADEIGMYFVFSSLTLIALGWHSWWVALPIWVALHYAALYFSATQTLAVIASLLVGAMLAQGIYAETLVALVTFAVAYVVKLKDHDHEDTFSLAHAFWHLATGCMIAFLYGVL